MEELLPDTPFRIEFEILNFCNRKCEYCFASPFDGKMLTLEDLKYIIDKTERQVQPFDVVFLGGEPFLRRDMTEILLYARSVFTSYVSVSTNGTLFKKMSKKNLRILRDLSQPDYFMQVSIDSTRDPRLSKSIESYEGIKILEEHEVPFTAGIVLTRKNIDSFSDTLDDLLKLSYLRAVNLQPLQFTNSSYFELNKLTQEEIDTVRHVTKKLTDSRLRTDVQFVGITVDQKDLDDYVRTGEELRNRQITEAGVYVDGGVSIDGTMGRHERFGNIFRQDWKDIWITAKEVYKSKMRETESHLKSRMNVLA